MLALPGTTALYATMTPTEHRAWAKQFKETGMVMPGLRHALALNTYCTLAAMQGTKNLGSVNDYLTPKPTGEQLKAQHEAQITAQAQAIERMLGL